MLQGMGGQGACNGRHLPPAALHYLAISKNSGRVGDNSRRQPRDRESRGCFVDVRSCLRPDFGKLRSRIVVQIVSDLFSKSQT